MTGSEGVDGMTGRLAPLLTGAVREAVGASDGRVCGVYLRSGTPGVLRLAALTGLPGPLFSNWWRVHEDRPFPVSDAHRNGCRVVLADAAETMRRYPQFAASLPYQFGSVYIPVTSGASAYGVLVVIRPAAPERGGEPPGLDRIGRAARLLGSELHTLEEAGTPVVWDEAPACVYPPGSGEEAGRIGRFFWDAGADVVTAEPDLFGLLSPPDGRAPTTARELARAVTDSEADARRVDSALSRTSAGGPSPKPLHVRAADGTLRVLELWAPTLSVPAPGGRSPVAGVVLDPGRGPAGDAAADPLPEGVFRLDRLGVVVYANARAAQALRTPRDRLLGRPLWEAVPWLGLPAFEDQLRGALLAPEPVHCHVPRPPAAAGESFEGDWVAMSVYPGPSVLTCTVVPSNAAAEAAASGAADPTGPTVRAEGTGTGAGGPRDEEAAPAHQDGVTSLLYRPIVLAIALTEAVTARQVSAVVMQELLPAFGGRRLALYLLQDRHLYLAWESGFPDGLLAPYEGIGLDARLPAVEALATGRPLFYDSSEQLAAAFPGVPLDSSVGARAFLPLIASGRPVGSCILGFEGTRRFSSEERTVLTALAGLIAHAMEKAQRYDTEAALARGLQQALLPRRLPAHPLVETAGRYLPGTQGMDVGGDWYDVVESGDGLALVIGDVQGHGVQAAATMGQLRSAVRAFALGDRPPDEVLGATNHLLIDLDPGQFASCCYVRLDPATGLARIARAGHPPPLLLRADGRAHRVETPGGVVLGVDMRADYPVTDLHVAPGAVLALYTDGLVERPGEDIDDGIAALREALSAAGGPADRPGGRALAVVADRLTEGARQAVDRPDDIALLLATRRTAPPPPPA
ncbi:SpoIIE family protein phosphatase [Streptomyces sp. NPDC008150]|uniref:SpoIIE family protein phosphatase n=1 Tax=Streptomyces sp. NPDC008150 TaxID=3364816 RepID=UPI0036E08E43